MVKKHIKNEIDHAIKQIWMNSISKDYRHDHLLKEDSLKNSFYYHLRRKLGTRFLEDNDIRIYTEFTDGDLMGTGFRADIAVVKLRDEKNHNRYHLREDIETIIAIIELKYSNGSNKEFFNDIEKIRNYIRVLKIDCLYYLVFIAEKEYENPYWLDGRATNNWANKKVAVLSANYKIDGNRDLQFYIQSCNGLNKVLD